MHKKKPVIGITIDHEDKPTYSRFPWYALRENYASAIETMGGIPILLPYSIGMEERYIDMIDGLMITGGNFDIDPGFYNQQIKSEFVTTKQKRTQFEYRLTQLALQQKMPILGICGGEQLLNVILGGSLIQHIPDAINSSIEHEPKQNKHKVIHEIEVFEDSLLYMIVQKRIFMVNSSHHQAVKDLGAGLKISAKAPDGVIEGIELKDYPFCLGVEWHPEYLETVEDKNIIKAFVKYCEKK